MKIFKPTLFFCLLFVYNTLAEEQANEEKLDSSQENTEKTVLEKSESYNRRISAQEPSFLSKLKNWIFPFGGTSPTPQIVDSIPAAGRQPYPIYGAPSSQLYRPECNSCNKEPWIPVAMNYGQSAIIGFVPPANIEQTFSTIEVLQAPPTGQYGVPILNGNYGPPKEQYFAFNHLNQNLSPPPTAEILSTPSNNYGLPQSQIPVQSINPLLNGHYDQAQVQLGDLNLNHVSQIETSIKNVEHVSQDYNLPSYVVPPKPIPQQLPNINYGLPKPEQHILLSAPNENYLQQRPGKSYAPQYRRPNSHGPLNYPPVPKDYVNPPPFRRGHPKLLPGSPRFVQKPTVKARPPHNQHSPPFFVPDMKPPLANSFITNYGVPINQPTIPSVQYGPPPENINIQIIPTVQVLPSGIPSDSYGAPVTGIDIDYGVSPQTSGREYLPPLNADVHVGQSLSLPIFDDILQAPKAPIPFPNLNHLPLTPIHDANDFHQNTFHADIGGEYQESRHREVYNINQIRNENQNKESLNTHQIVSGNQNQKGVTSVEIQGSQQVYSSQVGSGSYDQNSNNPNAFRVQNQENIIGRDVNDLVASPNQKEVVSDVQIVRSIPVANFLSSIEHPINIIQSPIVEVTANVPNINNDNGQLKNYEPTENKLSENPIIVGPSNYDSHPSASAQNASYQSKVNDYVTTEFSNQITDSLPNPNVINQILQSNDNRVVIEKSIDKSVTPSPSKFTPPPLDYTNWSPSTNLISASMIPPPPGQSHWITSLNEAVEIVTTTKKPKQIQIVIPYVTNAKPNMKSEILKGKKTTPYDYAGPKLSLYTQPPTIESVWLKYTDNYRTEESNKFTTVYPEQPKEAINIKEWIKKEEDKRILQNIPPFDVISLQKNIDDWTEQEFSRKLNRDLSEIPKSSTPEFFVPSKNIPTSYLSTNPYNTTRTSTLKYSKDFYDHEPAGSNKKEAKLTGNDDFENNFIITQTGSLPITTEAYTTTEYPSSKTERREETTVSPNWFKQQISFSGLNNEKIYVVTPQSLTRETTTPATVSFSHPPRIGGKSAGEIKDELNEGIRLIFSEWPHLINNLETTTTTQRPTSPHPLFGLMDLSSYIPPPNATIQTYAGHSKVITIVTPISFISRKEDVSKEKDHLKITTESSNKS